MRTPRFRALAAVCVVLFFALGCAAFASQEPTVWVASSGKGKRYHYEHCHTLRGAKHELPLSEAKAMGYTPCKVCGASSIRERD